MPTIELKINKRFFINSLLLIIVVVAALETIELGLLAYSVKSGLLCK